MGKYRQRKISDLLRDEVGKILFQELDLEQEALVTVTRAEATKDLQQAKVYVSILPSSLAEKIFPQIKKQIYFFQQILNKRLRIRPIPKISFILDYTEAEAAKIEKIIEKNRT